MVEITFRCRCWKFHSVDKKTGEEKFGKNYLREMDIRGEFYNTVRYHVTKRGQWFKVKRIKLPKREWPTQKLVIVETECQWEKEGNFNKEGFITWLSSLKPKVDNPLAVISYLLTMEPEENEEAAEAA